jgi:acyl-CoA thioester hydrolase
VKGALEPPTGREVFTLPLAIAPADIDENGHVNNVVYVRWLQEAGVAHWLDKFPGEQGKAHTWVVLRHEVDYRRALKLGDQARAKTWVGEPRGVRFDRYVLIEGPDGAAAQGHSEWALLDAATMRPRRIPAEIIARFLP